MNFRLAVPALALLLVLPGCRRPLTQHTETLAQARAGFTSHPSGERSGDPVPPPPANALRQITYPSPAGQLAAYVSLDPRDGKRHPAIVWITGGDCNSIGDVWSPPEPGNDQTAAV